LFVRSAAALGRPTDASNRAAVRTALFHAPKSRLLICRLPLGLCYSRRQLLANAAIAASRVGSLPLLHRCDLYRLTLVRRQDAAEGHAN
jgi:hypothetical protein